MSELPHRDPELQGCGALHVRPAVLEDLDGIFGLIDTVSRTTTVLPRSRENLCEHIRDFLVIEFEGEIVACGALSLFTQTLAEIKSLVVDPRMRGRGAGGGIVASLLEESHRLGVRRVFVLTDSVEFFGRQGFREVDKSTLPHKVWNECIYCPKFLNCQEVAMDMELPSIVELGEA